MPPTTRARMTDDELQALAGLVAAAIAGNGLGKQITEIRNAVLRLEEQFKVDHILTAKHELTLFGDEKTEGMVAQVRTMLKGNAVAIKVITIVGSIFIAAAAGAFIYLVVSHPPSVIH